MSYFIVSCVTFILILISVCSPAYAWKLKTHAYIANIVMEDAKDGKVWIPPYGEFEVRPQIVEAINLCPEFFRGGSIGPDGFPDFWTGQSIIHPQTDGWLRLLWDSLPPLNISQAASSGQAGGAKNAAGKIDRLKLQAWAFTFGYFSHCASDMWAHDWVNTYAGGVFPSLSEIKADPTNKIPIIARHISIENTLDKRITLSASTIDIPNDYVINTMVLNRQAIALGMNPVVSYFAVKYFEKLPHKDEVDYGTVGGKSGMYVGSGMTAPKKTYDAFWFDDLERGFKSTDAQNPGWMEANKRAIKDVMEKNKGMLGSLGSYLGMWSVTYFFDMLGFPSVTTYVGGSIASNQADIEWALSKIGLSEDVRSQITSDVVNVLLILSLGMDKTTFDRVWTTEMTSDLFSADKYAEIMADIGNPPPEAAWRNAWSNQANFNSLINSINGPLYNSVITTKLCMLKPSELERLLGKKVPGVTGEVIIIGAIKGIDFSRQFTKPDGLMADWLGYGLELNAVSPTFGKVVFPNIFKPYHPIDTTRQGVWSVLDANHRWGALYPLSTFGQVVVQPPVLSDIVMSQFNSETIEVEFKSDKTISTAALEYQTPSLQTKTTSWFSAQSLQPASGMKYTLSIHEAGMPAGMYKVKIKAKDMTGKETQTGFTDFALFGASADWGFTATAGANNTYVLSWNKYPRPGEFQKYVLGKGDQLPPPPPTTAYATSYDAAQMPQHGFQPIQIANVNTTTRIIPASLLANLTLSARSKRGNFLTKPLAPTVIQAQATTPTQSQPAPTTPAGVRAQQRYQ